MTDTALALSFFDPERDVHGVAREGFAVVFRAGRATALPEGPEVAPEGEGWRARADALELEFTPSAAPAELGGPVATACRVRGTVADETVDGLGLVTATATPPHWEELDLVRHISALFAPGDGVVAFARRPRDAPGHGEELVRAALLADGEALAVEDARISTVYDGEARPRTSGLEMWLPGEEFPRRAFGSATAGVSLALEGLDAHVALFEWQMTGATGVGVYELTARTPAPAAA